jgi:CBS domain-containing protein
MCSRCLRKIWPPHHVALRRNVWKRMIARMSRTFPGSEQRMTPELSKVSEELHANMPVLPVTVRTFLSWFNAQRRGAYVVANIRTQLEEAGVITYPDFETTYVDNPIGFLLAGSAEAKKMDETDLPEASLEELAVDSVSPTTELSSRIGRDPTYRVSKLKAANRQVISVKPDNPLALVVTTMMVNGYSQLPVMTNDRDVKGVVSWKSIGSRMAMGIQIKLKRFE